LQDGRLLWRSQNPGRKPPDTRACKWRYVFLFLLHRATGGPFGQDKDTPLFLICKYFAKKNKKPARLAQNG